ncbi:MAG: cyclic nucleotide-binding domain-containing protein, partial [Pseudomonadota bacterium]
DPHLHKALARDVVALRPIVHARLQSRGLDQFVHRFDPDEFNPAVPLGGNLLFAAPRRDMSPEELASKRGFMQMLRDQDLADEALEISQAVVDTLEHAFGIDGTDHPLFRKLGLEEKTYRNLVDIAHKKALVGRDNLSDDECALLLTIPFLMTAEQIGPAFPDRYKRKILALRKTRSEHLRAQSADMFVPIDEMNYIPRLTVLENAIFGRISIMAGAYAEEIEEHVAHVLSEHDLRRRVASIIYDMPTGLGGANLPAVIQERAAFSRAGIKRPNLLILDKALASHSSKDRAATRAKLQEILPETTMIFMEDHFEHPELYDIHIEIKNGRIDGLEEHLEPPQDGSGTDDLRKKLRIIAGAPLFEKLSSKNQRLLAFSAQRFVAEPGQVIFAPNQPVDAAYLCVSGQGELRWPDSAPDEPPLTTVDPGRLVGDLSIITGEPHQLQFTATQQSHFLRIGAEEFRSVVESDMHVALALLETVAGHLSGLAVLVRASGINLHEVAERVGMQQKPTQLETDANA